MRPVIGLKTLDIGVFMKRTTKTRLQIKCSLRLSHWFGDKSRHGHIFSFFGRCKREGDAAVRQFAPMTAASPTLFAPSIRRRLACWLYEGVLLFGVLFAVQGVAALLDGAIHPYLDAGFSLSQGTGQHVVLFLVLGYYFTWQWTRTGQTLPMRTWHVRVVNPDGSALTWPRAVVRYVFCWIWFLPPLAAVQNIQLSGTEVSIIVLGWVAVWAVLARFRRDTQFWHDVWAGTRLISAQPPSPETAP